MAEVLFIVDAPSLPPEVVRVINNLADHVLRLTRERDMLISSGGVAGCYIGTVVGGDVPAAADDDTPGVGLMDVRQIHTGATADQLKLRGPGRRVRILNIAKGASGIIADGKQIATMPILNKPGHQLVILDPCG